MIDFVFNPFLPVSVPVNLCVFSLSQILEIFPILLLFRMVFEALRPAFRPRFILFGFEFKEIFIIFFIFVAGKTFVLKIFGCFFFKDFFLDNDFFFFIFFIFIDDFPFLMGITPVFVFFFLVVFFGAVGLSYDLVLFLIESVFELIYAAGEVFDFPLLDGHEDVFEL